MLSVDGVQFKAQIQRFEAIISHFEPVQVQIRKLKPVTLLKVTFAEISSAQSQWAFLSKFNEYLPPIKDDFRIPHGNIQDNAFYEGLVSSADSLVETFFMPSKSYDHAFEAFVTLL